MKQYLFILIALIVGCSENNPNPISDAEIREERIEEAKVHFHSSERVPNSNYYYYPVSSNLDERKNRYSYKGDYDNRTWNLIFYNFVSGEKRILIDSIVPIIEEYPNNSDIEYLEESELENFKREKLKEGKIYYSIRMNDYNLDGTIDRDDPLGLFESENDGTKLRRISPKDLDLISWKFIDEHKSLIELKCMIDSNNDSLFLIDDTKQLLIANIDSNKIDYKILFEEDFLKTLKENYIDGK